MGGTSSPDLVTAPFESGMPRMVLQLDILSRGILARCTPSFTLPNGRHIYRLGILRQNHSNLDAETGAVVVNPLKGYRMGESLIRGSPSREAK